jgi:hypothetical protein
MDAEVRLNNLREAYHTLNDDVLSASHVMVGDPPRLSAVRDRALTLASAAELVHGHLFLGHLLIFLSTRMSSLPPNIACYRPPSPT